MASGSLAAGIPEAWLRASAEPAGHSVLAGAVRAERLRAGLPDLIPLSSALLEASSAAPPQRARALALLAADAAPNDPRPYWKLFLLSAQALRPGAALRELSASLRAAARDPWLQAGVAARTHLILWSGALLALAALLAVGVARYGRLWLHDYADAFPRKLRGATPWALGAFVLAALWSLGLGPWTWAALLAVCLGPYHPFGPRLALGVCLALSGILLPALAWVSAPAGPEGERAWTLYRAARGEDGPELERALARLFPPEDEDALRLRVCLARAQGRYDEGVELLKAGGSRTRGARLELGNLWLLKNSFAEAAAEYRRAAAQSPRDPVPWINLHLVELRRLALPAADKALEYARVLDRGADAMLRAADSFPLSPSLRVEGVRGRLFSRPEDRSAWGTDLPRLLVGGPAWFAAPGLGLAGLAGVLGAGLRKESRRSRRCPSCGATLCPRCRRRLKQSDDCPACWAMGVPGRVDAGEREKQEEAVGSWEARCRRWSRAGAVALPGWSEWPGGDAPVKALAVGAVWSLAGGAFLTGLVYPVPLLPWAEPSWPWLSTALLAAAHGFGVRRARAGRRERR